MLNIEKMSEEPEEVFVAPEMFDKVEKVRAAVAAIEGEWSNPGVSITFGWAIRFTGPGCWRAEICQERETKSGNRGKPEKILVLMGDTFPGLMADVAKLLDPATRIVVRKEKSELPEGS